MSEKKLLLFPKHFLKSVLQSHLTIIVRGTMMPRMTTIAPSANEVPVGGMYAMYCIVSIENSVEDTFIVGCCTFTRVCVDIVDP